ncbi:salt tolerance down-regulator-domain-containing protein, partial [Syncephalis pseudoplumigaleata]
MTTQRRFPAEEALPPPTRVANQPGSDATDQLGCRERTAASQGKSKAQLLDDTKKSSNMPATSGHTLHTRAALDVAANDAHCHADRPHRLSVPAGKQQQQQQPESRVVSAKGSESECSVSSGYSAGVNGSGGGAPGASSNIGNHTSGVKAMAATPLPAPQQHADMALHSSLSTSSGGKKKKKKHRKGKVSSMKDADLHHADDAMQHIELYERFHDGRYQYQMQAYDAHYDYDLWSNDTYDNRQKIREFWLQLGEEERRALVKVEKEAVLQKLKEQQKRNCS